MKKNSQQIPKILLIDALNIIFQSYYGSLHMKASKNDIDYQMLYVYMRKLQSILRLSLLRKITHACLVFDSRMPNSRRKIYPGYKSNRTDAPFQLVKQIKIVKRLSKYFGINLIEIDYAEADDTIGFLKKEFLNEFNDGIVYIFSTDRDFLQLMGPQVNIVKKINNRNTIYTMKHYNEQWKFQPEFMIDYKSICGDASDNIPGVKGVGPVMAGKLITAFQTVEGIYQNLEEIKNERIKNLFLVHHDHVLNYKKIITIMSNLNEKIDFTDYTYPSKDHNFAKYNELCTRYEMDSVKKV